MQLFVFDRYTPDVPNVCYDICTFVILVISRVFFERDFRPGFLRYYQQPLCLNQILAASYLHHLSYTKYYIISIFFLPSSYLKVYFVWREDIDSFQESVCCASYALVHIITQTNIYMYINQSIHQIVSLPIYYYLFNYFFFILLLYNCTTTK